eukprot:Selendium_serpulae@DN6141_c0_g1_i1.p1
MGCACSTSGNDAGEDIRQHYKIGAVLGSGSFGQVRLCTRMTTGEVFAVKIMAKTPPKKSPKVDHETMFMNEVEMLKQLEHENVVHFLEFFEDKHFLYAVMEKCDGGELFTKIVKNRKFTEADAAALARQMLSAIHYVHSLQIVHRDIKAENFLFKQKEDPSPLLLIDFGMATRLADSDKILTQLCGSPHYVAPELIRRQYRFQVDMWALGVMIYLMLFGKYPFESQDHKTIVQQILKNEPDYAKGTVRPSAHAVDFMKRLLAKNPERRMTAAEALQHAWVSDEMGEENASHSITEETIREAHRKSSVDRDELDRLQSRRYDSKLSRLEEDYIKQRSLGTRKFSAGSTGSGKLGMDHDQLPSGHQMTTVPVHARSYSSSGSLEESTGMPVVDNSNNVGIKFKLLGVSKKIRSLADLLPEDRFRDFQWDDDVDYASLGD